MASQPEKVGGVIMITDIPFQQRRSRPLLGEILREAGVIDETSLDIALEDQRKTRHRLGRILLQKKMILKENDLLQALGQQMGLPVFDLKSLTITPELSGILPAKYAVHYKVVPISFEEGVLTLAAADPSDPTLVDELTAVTQKRVR